MVEANEVEARIDRARAEDMEFTRINTDPRLLHVENSDGNGDTPYMIAPNALACSCNGYSGGGSRDGGIEDTDEPDDSYRSPNPVCKHQIALAMEESPDGELMREAIGDQYESLRLDHLEIQQNVEDLQSLMNEIESKVRSLELVRSNLDVTPEPANPENETTEEERQAEMEEDVLPKFEEIMAEVGGDSDE